MTITDTTPRTLADLTEDELAAAWASADIDNPAVFTAFMAEFDQRAAAERERRDRAARMNAARSARAAILAEGYDAAYAQYLKASEHTRGVLLSDLGKKRVTDEMSLWTGSEETALRNASEELRDFWMFVEPRMTPGTYARQRADQVRIEREAARDAADIEGTTDDGMAEHEAGALRPERAAAEAPPAGTRGTVLRGGHRPGTDAEDSRGAADGRPGPVRPVQRVGGTVGIVTSAVRAAAAHDRQQARHGVMVPRAAAKPAVRKDDGPRIPGDQLLDLLESAWFSHYARLPSQAAADALTLWAAHCWMRDESNVLVFRATPRLYLLSSEPGSGKSHVLELLSMVVPHCHGLDLEPTAPGLAYTLSREHATVLLDEGDILMAGGTRRQAVRAIINGGYTRHGTMLNGKGAKATRIPVFGPLALAGLDTMETGTGDTLNALFSRGFKIRMTKAPSDNPPAKLNRAAEEAAAKAKVWLERWAGQVRDEVADAEPEIPEGLEGRAEQIWIPLLAIADAAGGTWPDRARAACRELTLAEPQGEDIEEDFAAFASEFAAL